MLVNFYQHFYVKKVKATSAAKAAPKSTHRKQGKLFILFYNIDLIRFGGVFCWF